MPSRQPLGHHGMPLRIPSSRVYRPRPTPRAPPDCGCSHLSNPDNPSRFQVYLLGHLLPAAYRHYPLPLSRFGINSTCIFDTHYPDREVTALLIHLDVETELTVQLSRCGIKTLPALIGSNPPTSETPNLRTAILKHVSPLLVTSTITA